MIIAEVKIHHVRAISTAHLNLAPRFNFVDGANGSGKTSLLEALYLLSCGHSFRSRELAPIIAHGQSQLNVFARSLTNDTVSIQKSASLPTQIKLNNQFCHSTSQLAYALPCQVFYSDLFQIIDAGPAVRRSVLDWGLFHVKRDYLTHWKRYKKVLKQRNALLKTRVPYSQFVPWDMQLNELAVLLSNLRQQYFLDWQEEFNRVLAVLSDVTCSIRFYKGWDRKNSGKELFDILAEQFDADTHKQYTQYGAHQADIIIEASYGKAKSILSRGQQKIILFALKIAQTRLLKQQCLYLIDDLAAELDLPHQKKVLALLADGSDQLIITNTSTSHLNLSQFDNAHYFSSDCGLILQVD